MRAQAKRTPWLWPLLLIAMGVVLLLDNLLLIDLDVASLWPVVFIALGLQLLVRGDIAPSWQAHTFGITRGSVQTGSVEIESGEVDVQLRALRKSGRLIAGQYTARSRPNLTVRNNHARVRMQRGQTWWLSMADWDVGLAEDLPWEILASSYLGELEFDLRGLLVRRVALASGLASVTLTCPETATGPLYARSTLGNVRVTVPEGSRARITVKGGPFGRVRVNPARFGRIQAGVFATTPPDDNPLDDVVDLDITVSTVFGSIVVN